MRLLLLLYLFIFKSILFCQPITVNKPYPTKTYQSFSSNTQNQITNFFNLYYSKGHFNGTFLFCNKDSLLIGKKGFANFANRDSFIVNDIFQLASVSKTFTGCAVMLLVQEGKLHLEDSVHWFLPNLKRKNLVVKNLLSHTSGLPDYFDFDEKYWPKSYGKMYNPDVVLQVNAQPFYKFNSPNGNFDYCNTNFTLLASIVEQVTQAPFRTFVKERIMKPANMQFSHVNNFDSVPIYKYVVQGYDRSRLYDDLAFNGTTGDKGVYSNVYEMLLYAKMLKTEELLHLGIKDLMWQPTALASASKGMYYGLGWRMLWINGQKWVFHNGWWKGFRTYFWTNLNEDKFFVVLTNNVQGPFLKTSKMVELFNTVPLKTNLLNEPEEE